MRNRAFPTSTTTLGGGESIVSVSPQEYHHVLDLLESAFPDTQRTFFSTITLHDPWYDEKFSLALIQNRKYLSHVQIFDRTLIMEGEPVRFGGIGSVGTHPEERGKGYATALMNHGLELMANEGMKGSLLFTRINSFYEDLGWKTLRQFDQLIPVEGLKKFKTMPARCRILRGNDYTALHEMYSNQHEFIPGLLQRNLDYWEVRSKWMNHVPSIIEIEGKPAGYFYTARYHPDEPVLNITEFGLQEPKEQIIQAMLGYMALKAEDVACCHIKGFFAQHPLIKDFLQSNKIPMTDCEHSYVMWRDLNESGLFDKIQSLVKKKRWLYWTTDAF